MNIHDMNNVQRAIAMSTTTISHNLGLQQNHFQHVRRDDYRDPHRQVAPEPVKGIYDGLDDSRATLNYGAGGADMTSSWGVESRTPEPMRPPMPPPQPPLMPPKPDLPVHKSLDTSLPMAGPDPVETLGQYVQRIGPIVQRIDVSHDEPHLNQSLSGVGKKVEKKLFKSDWKDFHRRDL